MDALHKLYEEESKETKQLYSVISGLRPELITEYPNITGWCMVQDPTESGNTDP